MKQTATTLLLFFSWVLVTTCQEIILFYNPTLIQLNYVSFRYDTNTSNLYMGISAMGNGINNQSETHKMLY